MTSGSTRRLTYLHDRRFLFPVFSPDGNCIFFTARGVGFSDIHRMNADGSGLTRLTNGEWMVHDLVFSPDGTQIAFLASPPHDEDSSDIYRMNADGTEPRALTTTRREYSPTFSPDGQHIAFVSGRDKRLEIYHMRSDGSRQQRLTYVWDRPEQRTGPSPKNLNSVYSPDGEWILFRSVRLALDNRPEHAEQYVIQPGQIYRIRPDGTDEMPFITLEGVCGEIMFSPDGKRLAFINSSYSRVPRSNICVVAADGSGLTTFPQESCMLGDFHPDGRHIVFSSIRDRKTQEGEKRSNDRDLYCLDIEADRVDRLTDNVHFDGLPAFSPDGKQMAFCSNRDGSYEIYAMTLLDD